jgi:hypothetical protein
VRVQSESVRVQYQWRFYAISALLDDVLAHRSLRRGGRADGNGLLRSWFLYDVRIVAEDLGSCAATLHGSCNDVAVRRSIRWF